MSAVYSLSFIGIFAVFYAVGYIACDLFYKSITDKINKRRK